MQSDTVRSSPLALLLGTVATALLLVACTPSSDATDAPPVVADSVLPASVADTATFAGGCFWCMEPPYDKIDGVAATISGFSGGSTEDPSYRQVASGMTNHTETVQVIYDSTKVNYKRLLRVYWHNVDPFDGTGQFCDRGSQYRPAIFVHDDRQRRLAKQTKSAVADRFSKSIAVEIQPFSAFYAAEAYHQNYYEKNPQEYKRYRRGCGRDARLRAIWGEAAGSDAALARR
ncbi:MAG: peptide-methionine (S)-S-oxide reductase MsrA [Salinibacter sp.]